jgi:hypothetical protein
MSEASRRSSLIDRGSSPDRLASRDRDGFANGTRESQWPLHAASATRTTCTPARDETVAAG